MLDFPQKLTLVLIGIAVMVVIVITVIAAAKAFAKYGVIAAIMILLGGASVSWGVAHIAQAPGAVDNTVKDVKAKSEKFQLPDIPSGPVGR